jgi:mRNA-degrading endonuclease RelE of RelBE toxin-antitoxin system
MNSSTLPSFWKLYKKLDANIQKQAVKAFHLWSENPFHPSLHFKCINSDENIWSIRISLGYRAIGVIQNENITWFWIGSHDQYERFFK